MNLFLMDVCRSCLAKQAAEKLDAEGGGGFNPRIKPIESMAALAVEEQNLQIVPEIALFRSLFSQGSLKLGIGCFWTWCCFLYSFLLAPE